MRPISARAVVRPFFGLIALTLAAGLVVTPQPAGHAAARHPAPTPRMRFAPGRPVPPVGGISAVPAGETSVAPVGASTRTGILTGLVRDGLGRPFAGACVRVFGPGGTASAVTSGSGRYLLTGLRPGRYRLRAGTCRTTARVAARPVISLWAGLPATVMVAAGKLATLPPVVIKTGGRVRSTSRPAGLARAKTATISGVVTGHGRPLAGICVAAVPVNGGEVPEAITSKTGRYRISQIPPGGYQVEFADLECQPGNWLTQWYPGINTLFIPFGATQFNLRPGEHVTGIDGKLALGGEIAGTVRSTSGRTLGGICVELVGNLPDNSGLSILTGDDNHGFVAFHALFPGQYTVEFSSGCGNKGNYAFQWWKGATLEQRATVIPISGHRTVTNVDPVMRPGALVTGTVRGGSAAGPPLPNVCLSAFGRDGNDYADSVTVARGRYTLTGLATGRYQLVFDPACGPAPVNYRPAQRSVSVTAGKTRSGVDIALPVGGILSGKVTDSRGHPVGGVCVLLGDQDGHAAITSFAGTYSMVGIQPGSYPLEFAGGCGNAGSLAPQFYRNQPDPLAANTVRLLGGKTTAHVDAVMQPGGTVAGVITNSAGRRLAGVCVGVANQNQIAFGQSASVNTARNGRYVVANLAPGPYLVQFHCAGSLYASQWFHAQPDSTTADLISVNPGDVTAASAALSLAGSISGTISDPAGHPLSSVCVTVSNARDKLPVDIPFNFTLGLIGPGHYRIGGLPAGKYLVGFIQCQGKARFGTQWYRDQATETAATPVTVKAGRPTRGIDATMTVGGSISGRVTGPAGRPVGGFCVAAIDQPARSQSIATTNRTGRYTFTGLASGRYSLSFFACLGPSKLESVTRPGLVKVTAPQAATGADIKLAVGGSVAGLVTLAGGPTSPLNQVCVQFLPVGRGVGGVAFTGPDGRFTGTSLATGRYQVLFADPACEPAGGIPAPQWFDNRPTQARANDVTVTTGHLTGGISAVLRPYGGIAGTVTTGAAGVSGECVTAIPVHPSIDPFSGSPLTAEVAVSGHAGQYALADLPPGSYRVEFTAGCGDSGFAPQWWKNASSQRSATPITVRYAPITAIDATLRKAA